MMHVILQKQIIEFRVYCASCTTYYTNICYLYNT